MSANAGMYSSGTVLRFRAFALSRDPKHSSGPNLWHIARIHQITRAIATGANVLIGANYLQPVTLPYVHVCPKLSGILSMDKINDYINEMGRQLFWLYGRHELRPE